MSMDSSYWLINWQRHNVSRFSDDHTIRQEVNKVSALKISSCPKKKFLGKKYLFLFYFLSKVVPYFKPRTKTVKQESPVKSSNLF